MKHSSEIPSLDIIQTVLFVKTCIWKTEIKEQEHGSQLTQALYFWRPFLLKQMPVSMYSSILMLEKL